MKDLNNKFKVMWYAECRIIGSKLMKKNITFLINVLILLVTASGTQAASLQDLFAGDSITVGDKVFDDWSLLGQTDPVTGSIDLSLIDVTGINSDPLNPGLLFTANNQLSVNGTDFLDLNFGFSVTVLDPQFSIKDFSLGILDFDADVGLILIEEQIFDENFNSISFKDAFVDNLLNTKKLSNSDEFSPLDKIFVEKIFWLPGLLIQIL
jgi:hypothetical protein